MEDGGKRLLANGRIKAIIGEDGVEILEIGGEVFEGFDSYVPVPLKHLRNVRVGEIPEGVYIEPVEAVEGNTVYMASLGTSFPFEVRYWSGGAEVELNVWPGDWDEYVSLHAYMEGFTRVLRLMEEWGFIEELEEDFSGDMYHLSFELPLPGDMTLLRGLSMIKRLLREVEEAARRIAYSLALEEIRRGSGEYDPDALLERLDGIMGRYGV